MKTRISNLFLLPALIAGLNLIPAGWVTAQTFTILHRFQGDDGTTPVASLILSSNTLYGTAESGGNWGNGTVFAVHTDGTDFTNLHSFTALSDPYHTNSDGAAPQAGLILSGGTLYGTAAYGGSSGTGTVFAVNTGGEGFKTLHTFAGYPNDGAIPVASLILSGNTLYGTTAGGGNSDSGIVFAINTDGAGFTNLHSFTARSNDPPYTNSDGASPQAGLILSGNTLYGTAVVGGSSGFGTVFAINTNGTGFTTLHSFTTASGSGGYSGTNSDGAYPNAGLVLSGATLYGTTESGGRSGCGTVFAITTNASEFTTMHSFTSSPSGAGDYHGTNSDGALPHASLIVSGTTLYGVASEGGSSSFGTVFAITTNGTFTTLHSFTSRDGIFPSAGLLLSGNTLYGTASDDFTESYGTVFSLSFSPQLTITPSGAKVILSWPTNVAGFDYPGYTLQSTTNLVSPAVWNTNSPAPVVVNGQNTVTTLISGVQRFYRLSQ